MASFTDKTGRVWQIDVDVYIARDVKKKYNVDLLNLYDDTTAATLLGNVETLVDVLYELCREQCEKLNVTARDFGAGLVGDSIEGATKALLEGVRDFFPARKRAMMSLMMARSQIAVDELTALQLKALMGQTLPPSIGASDSPAN